MWFDSEEDTLEFLLRASLQPEQGPTGAWHLVLHRALKLDPQAASFRQRSARLCNQQLHPRSRNVHDQAQPALAAVAALVAGAMAGLQSRPPASPGQYSQGFAPSPVPQQQLGQQQQPVLPHTPLAHNAQVG